MSERRESVRVEWHSNGIVVGADGVRHACLVNNLSDGGARISRLDVDMAVLSDELRLRLAGERGAGRMCRVAWRTQIELGIEFVPFPTAFAPVAPRTTVGS